MILIVALMFFSIQSATGARAADFMGPENCAECHKAQYDVLKKTAHSRSFRTVDRKAVVDDIIVAAGGDRTMKRNQACVQCHFTDVPHFNTLTEGDGRIEGIIAGVSCEHCHGASSGWNKLHQDFGGKRQAESPEHKARRIAASKAAGLIYPDNLLALATRCVECHGMTKAGIDGDVYAQMIRAGHPMDYDYEFVRFSQGSVRHRFYPPNLNVNQETTKPELARLYVIGQIAKLVAAKRALDAAKAPSYRTIQSRLMDAAKSALAPIRTMPEAEELLAHPDSPRASRLVDAIKGKDLTAKFSGQIPSTSDFK